MNLLVSLAVMLGLLVVGRPLLIPLALAVLLWAVLNALIRALRSIGLSVWLSWISSSLIVALIIASAVRVFAIEGTILAAEFPAYMAKLERLSAGWPLRLRPEHVIAQLDLPGLLTKTAASAAHLVVISAEVATYTIFMLVEQHALAAKLANVGTHGQEARARVLHDIAHQVQAYLGVTTLVSLIMGATTFALLKALGVDLPGLWALMMFLLTFVPTIGGFGVILPALIGAAQFGSVTPFFIIGGALGATHVFLTNVVETILLGRSLNLSLLAIILSLSFWGLTWGVAGLFLAVPILGAMVIVCRHVDGLTWIAVFLAGPPPGAAIPDDSDESANSAQ